MKTSALLPTYETLPLDIVRGEGMWLYSKTNQAYLDLYGGHAVALLGHSHPKLIDEMHQQAQTLLFYSNVLPLTIREQASQALAELLPATHRHLFFCNSGAEANENALKLAIQLTGRYEFIALKGSFHGRTLLANAVTDSQTSHKKMGPWIDNRVTFITPNALEELEQINTKTAAVILEPIQSIAGVVTLNTSYLQALKQRCQETQTLLIIDEVQTGMGRCGHFFLSEQILPDMFTTAKGLASGFPIGALFLHEEIAAQIKIGDLGSTFGGGPLAMAALKATIDILLTEQLLPHVQELTQYIQDIFSIPEILEIRGCGCLLGLKTKQPAQKLVQQLLARGIIAGTTKDPDVIRLLPPLIMQKQHLNYFKEILLEELNS